MSLRGPRTRENPDVDADDWNARYRSTDLVWSADANSFLVDEVAGLAPGTALELGCGEGRNAIWLAANGWAVTAADFASVAVDKARSIAAERGLSVDWHVADVVKWRPGDTYDLVVVLYVQLPQPERAAMLATAATALAPGGTLLVVAHARRNLAEGFGGPQDPAVLPDPDEVEAEILAAGTDVEIERAGEIVRSIDTPDGPRTAFDLLVRARRRLR